MKFEVLILGNSSATPMFNRHPTAQVLNFNEQLILIDCGEGTQMQLVKYGIKTNRINAIFISHLHGDHYLGLVGLISSMSLHGRHSDLHLFGPAPLKEILDLQFLHAGTQIQFNLIFHPTNSNAAEVIYETKSIQVSSFPLKHRVPTTGFRFEERAKLATLQIEKVQALGVPVAFYNLLKAGVDCTDIDGTVYQAAELTLPSSPARSYAFCSDTLAFQEYMQSIQEVDLLYHESTFLHELVMKAKDTFHSTSLEAAQVAKRVGAKKLLLGHYSARYKDLSPILEEAKSEFSNSELSTEGNWYKV